MFSGCFFLIIKKCNKSSFYDMRTHLVVGIHSSGHYFSKYVFSTSDDFRSVYRFDYISNDVLFNY